jgi:hypothetical protein
MKRLSPTELGGVILGAILFVGGLVLVIWPQPGVVPHFTNNALGMSPRSEMEVVSASGARLYGILGMLLGSGIVLLAVYRGKT